MTRGEWKCGCAEVVVGTDTFPLQNMRLRRGAVSFVGRSCRAASHSMRVLTGYFASLIPANAKVLEVAWVMFKFRKTLGLFEENERKKNGSTFSSGAVC